MDPIKNPYNPGAGTQPPAFVGRESLLRDFEIALERTLACRPGKSLMPIGLRGVGKTVLLNHFIEIANARKCRVAYLEASEAGDFRHIIVAQLRKALGELDGDTAFTAPLFEEFMLRAMPEEADARKAGRSGK